MLSFHGTAVNDLSLGSTLDVDAFTGAATLCVPVPAPEGRSGFNPELVLAYASGSGNSPYGAGWSLSGIPSIGIDTRHHVPRWDGTDDFCYGNDELVPWLEKAGASWTPRGFASGNWSVAFYRSRRGNAKSRIEKWVDLATGRVHFRTRDAYNRLTIFGARQDGSGRIYDPDDESRIFAWLPELTVDTLGNAQSFEYAKETNAGIDRSAPFESRRTSLAQRYLKRISYANDAPFVLTPEILSGAQSPAPPWRLQVVFDYGDHSDPIAPAAVPDIPWPVRADPFSTYSCGFEVRTYRLLQRILSFHNFPELGPNPTLVRSLELTHSAHPLGSTLSRITLYGYRWDTGAPSRASLPPLKMTYAPAAAPNDLIELPQASTANAPVGLSGGYSFVDVDGVGLAGMLYQNDRTWYFKPNLGGGVFGPQQTAWEAPAGSASAFSCCDLDANGNTEFALLAGREAGLYEFLRSEDRWTGFRAFEEFPHVEGLTRGARWVDFNGDRRPDLVLTCSDRFVWFPSQGDRFGAPVNLPKPATADALPTLIDDVSVDYLFADMTGDGLADLVRVSNRSVVYWPSLGNGAFGAAVVMEGAPQFSVNDDAFDASRIRFADLDGSGTTDLIYLGQGEVTCWINARGNRLVPGPRLNGLPYFDNVSHVSILDFLGDGGQCLVWSSPLAGRETPLEYLPLTPSVRPRLLLSFDDSLGHVTTLSYSSSATHYLRDLASGRGWSSSLPGHRPVVDRREERDAIANTTTVRTFAYHDGYYDGEERELRGFGSVDLFDADLSSQAPLTPSSAPLAPPLLERRWFHLGTPMWAAAEATGSYRGDPLLPFLSPHVVEASDVLSADEIDDGLRALAGELIRQERYAVDDTGVTGADPLEVVQRRFRLRPLQPATPTAGAAFSKLAQEHLTAVYEGVAKDPRVTHEIILDADAYERPLREARIAYPRRNGIVTDLDAQGRFHISVRDNTWISFDTPDRYEHDIPCESKEYELAGLRPQLAFFAQGDFRRAAVLAALAAPGRHDVELADDPIAGPKTRLLSWEQTFYWNDGVANAAALGSAGFPTLLHHEEAVCFEPAFIADVFGARVDNPLLTSLGYQLRDGFWWQADETHNYLPAAQFYQKHTLLRPDGAVTSFAYDAYGLLVNSYTDALNNTVRGLVDYHELALNQINDPNGTVREVRYDPLGVIVASTAHGAIGAHAWGFNPLPVETVRPATVADVVTNATMLLTDAAEYTWYDLSSWTATATPPTVVRLARESLINDGTGGGTPAGAVQIVVSYLDGGGRILQEKALVGPGPAITRDGAKQVVVDGAGAPVLAESDPRWRSSGYTAYDAKDRPGRVFEPFFTPTFAFENDATLRTVGTSTSFHYDVVGRATGQNFANGTFTRATFRPWSVEHEDPNDTVLVSAYGAARQALPAGDPELQAYQEAVPHANTPQIVYLDPLGREAGLLKQGGGTAPDAMKLAALDPNGDEVQTTDPRGLVAARTRFDMQRRVLYEFSVDSGERWRLPDAYSREVREWDSRNFAIVRGFDAADRPTYIQVHGGDGPAPLDHRVETWTYGEDLANRADAIARNLLGQVAIVRDASGQMTVGICDPDGHPTDVSHQLRTAVDNVPDWRVAVALDAEIVHESAAFDGLGRVLADVLADGTKRTYRYDQGGVLTNITVTTPDGSVAAVPILKDASVNARGQRISAALGNGAALRFNYDPTTYRLTTQTATRVAQVFQQLSYTYDPVGNLVRLTDAAQEGAASIIYGVTVPARRDYRYDAHYRLRQATGRVHQALLINDFVPGAAGTFKGSRHITLNNGAAIERFTRMYDYDKSGNLLYAKHAGTSRMWKTDMWVSTTSNRSQPALDHNGNAIPTPQALYDGAGNPTALAHLRAISWTWRNALDRAVIISRPGGIDDAESYAYGADALRSRKVSTRRIGPDVTEVTDTVYFNDIERKRITRNGAIVLERWSVRVNDGHARVAIINRWTKDDRARETDDLTRARIRYQLGTHQASIAIELDETGRLISYEEYFPYGGTAFIAGNNQREVSFKDYRYSGQICDDVTGLYVYGHRYYAPWLYRWLTPDPSGPSDDLNLYQFALGDPVRNVDPDGLDTEVGKVLYQDRVEAPLPAHPTDEQLIAAERATLSPATRAMFDSLSPADQLRFAKGSNLALVPKDMDDLEVGAKLVSRKDFFRVYLPKGEAWAKKHHIDVLIERTVAAPTEDDGDKDIGLADPDAMGDGTGQTGEGTQGVGSGGSKTGGEGSGATGSGTTDSAGTRTLGTGDATGTGAGSTGTATASDGKGAVGTGTSPTNTGPGTGATAGGNGGGQRSNGYGGGQTGTGKGKVRNPRTGGTTGGLSRQGRPDGSESGVGQGGREDGVLGGTPFATSNNIDSLGDPLTNASNSNGSEKDGLAAAAHRQRGGAGSDTKTDSGKGKGAGSGRGTPTGSGGPPGFNNKGALNATAAANLNSNSHVTGHGEGDGAGTNASGETGATATVLKIAGYLNLQFGDGDANGGSGGIPGGQGKIKGKFWQFLYVLVTVIDTILIVRSIIKSVAEGALRRIFNALRSPRALIRSFGAFLKEGAKALREQWGSGIRAGLGQMWRGAKSLVSEKGFIRFFRGPRAGQIRTIAEEADAIIKARNKSFWFKPRWFGRAGDGLYSTEHLIPKSWAANRPWLRGFVQSYANTFLRLPTATNTALGARILPRTVFYYGAARALTRSWQFGNWVGDKILHDGAQPETVAQPAR